MSGLSHYVSTEQTQFGLIRKVWPGLISSPAQTKPQIWPKEVMESVDGCWKLGCSNMDVKIHYT